MLEMIVKRGVVAVEHTAEAQGRDAAADEEQTEHAEKKDPEALSCLLYTSDQKITFANAFEIADDVLRQAVQSISDLIRDTGFINLDFADVTRCV